MFSVLLNRKERARAMKLKQSIFIMLAVLVVLALVGCGENARMASAHRRYHRMLEQARMEAAQESIEQGRFEYAIALLEDLVETDSAFADQAREMLDQLRTTRKEVAQASMDVSAGLGVIVLN